MHRLGVLVFVEGRPGDLPRGHVVEVDGMYAATVSSASTCHPVCCLWLLTPVRERTGRPEGRGRRGGGGAFVFGAGLPVCGVIYLFFSQKVRSEDADACVVEISSPTGDGIRHDDKAIRARNPTEPGSENNLRRCWRELAGRQRARSRGACCLLRRVRMLTCLGGGGVRAG